MNKSQLIETLARTDGLTIKKAEQVVDIFFGSIVEGLTQGDLTEIRGFGSFKLKD